jgi:hypothetical protein
MNAHTRISNEVANLVLDYDGAGHITFKSGSWFETYYVLGGRVAMTDCSDRGTVSSKTQAVVNRTARAYAVKLAATQLAA